LDFLGGPFAVPLPTQHNTNTNIYAPRGIRNGEFYCSSGRDNGHCEGNWRF